MNNIRKISKIVKGKSTKDGAGVKLVRVFGFNDVLEFDPFLMLDAFDSINPEDYTKGFPWHPHRGIETITYLIKGDIEHGDSLGNKGSILDGDCQWMTGGSGIIHQEMPKECDRMLGVQLWLNLPAKDKMTEPKYRDIVNLKIPIVEDEKAKIHIISGKYNNIEGAMQGEYVKVRYLDVEIKGNKSWDIDTDSDTNLFIYIIDGEGTFDEDNNIISQKNAILFTLGETIRVTSGDKGIRFLLLEGKPLKEPIAWGGPIVMNTQEELNKAFDDLEKNTFIK